jgi:hypothetical protein
MSLILALLGCDDGSFSFGSARSDGDNALDPETCDEQSTPGEIVGPDCLSGTLACDGALTGTTEGGEASLHGGDYQGWYCMTGTESDWTGSERVYDFIHPGTGTVTLSLSSPCGALTLIAMAWADEDVCPYPGVSVLECDADTSSIEIWNSSETRYVLIVDGEEDQPFSLSASCPSADR